ncbi:MAG: hypothetical protein QXS02_01370 [Candidatus Thermoplasmatota archaeon]
MLPLVGKASSTYQKTQEKWFPIQDEKRIGTSSEMNTQIRYGRLILKKPLLDGKRWKALFIFDDYSRFLISLKFLESVTNKMTTPESNQYTARYQSPEEILIDNGTQFLQEFIEWRSCPDRQIEMNHTNHHTNLKRKGRLNAASYLLTRSSFLGIRRFITLLL